jgi:membrane-associated phospholipid phosphatase
MTNSSDNRFTSFAFAILLVSAMAFVNPAYSQSSVSDSSSHPYHVNYWVTGTICGVGAVANILGIPQSQGKEEVTPSEMQALNRSDINGIDSWALRQDPTKIATYESYSSYALALSVALPAVLMFDKRISRNWLDVALMYAETMSITTNMYEWSFLGPAFQNKFRPVVYYDQLSYEQRNSGSNRNSFYSGHVATAAASTFFMAKVYCDYHPELGDNQYLIYGAATIPPLILGYFRVKGLKHFPSDVLAGLGIGALCGILIPEFHRLQEKNISLGLVSSPEGTGIAVAWHPGFLK